MKWMFYFQPITAPAVGMSMRNVNMDNYTQKTRLRYNHIPMHLLILVD